MQMLVVFSQNILSSSSAIFGKIYCKRFLDFILIWKSSEYRPVTKSHKEDERSEPIAIFVAKYKIL